MDQWDEIVWRRWPYMIIKTVRPSCIMYSVYKASYEGTAWEKLNDKLSWYTSERAALDFIEEHAKDYK